MKKILRVITALTLLCCILMLSACSDFDFNPLGKWKFTSYIVNNEECIDMVHNTNKLFSPEDPSLYWVFEKNGTAYMLMGNEKLQERTTYTYEYDKQNINIYVYDTFTNEIDYIQEYTISENGQTIVWTVTDEEGNTAVRTYTRV
ncbi:MAG: hypothetical protein ACI4M3_08605 [Acutalibacteraceae bacterium]